MEFQDKRKIKRFVYSRTVLIVLIIFIIILLNAVWKVYRKQAITKINLNKTASVYSDLKNREETLSNEITRLKSDNGREEEIREKYGMIKANEEVIVIIDNKDNNDVNISADNSWWRKIKEWFK